MDEFLKRQKLPKPTQEEKENLKSPICIKEIENFELLVKLLKL